MLLSIATFAAPAENVEDRNGFEPGIFSLFGRVISAFTTFRDKNLEANVSDFIQVNGGALNDDLERRIGTGYFNGQF